MASSCFTGKGGQSHAKGAHDECAIVLTRGRNSLTWLILLYLHGEDGDHRIEEGKPIQGQEREHQQLAQQQRLEVEHQQNADDQQQGHTGEGQNALNYH